MSCSVIEIIEKQDEIIRLQSGIIKELSALLLQHISAEEIEGLPAFQQIERTGEILTEIER